MISASTTLDGLVIAPYNVCIAGNDKRTPAPQVEPESENPNKREETMSNVNAAARRKKIEQLARQNYGSTSTCGPRQVAVIADIAFALQNGLRPSVDLLRLRHPLQGNSTVIDSLRARRLITGHPNNLKLTPAGLEIARSALRCTVAPGMGLVAIGAPSKRP